MGKPDFEYNSKEITDELLQLGFYYLEIEFLHLYGVANLPQIHRDPFDRLLIVQAEQEKLYLLTADNAILRYNKSFILDIRTI